MRQKQWTRRSTAVLTAALMTAGCLSFERAASVEYNTWTGYVLRDDAGKYLSVPGGTEAEGIYVGFFEADGAAAYNTWYFTETNFGITIKSALSEGQYYLAEDGNGSLYLSTTPGEFVLSEDGTLSGFRSGVENPVYAKVTPEAVTNLRAGDVNQDDVLNGQDLALLRQLTAAQNGDFVQNAMGDLDGDGTLTGADVSLLQRYLLGESLSFPAPQIPECTVIPTPVPPEPVVTETTPVFTTTTGETTTETSSTTAESTTVTEATTVTTTTTTAEVLTLADLPAEYQYAADWIWENRITAEKSTERRNTIFDQIVAGKGTINYVIRWQSYKTVTYDQRKQFEQLVSDSINDWAQWLVGYENWPYDHIEVNVVGWAVIDKSCLLDLHDDEVVYTDTIPYDSQYDTSNGYETIPDVLPCAPDELSRMEHWADTSYEYPGGLDKRFDMYLWATQGFPSIGGCGGDWGQRLSDDAYLNMLDGTGLHVLEHELGHGFGMTDFYGGEGESDGFPPGGFPGGENSLMMAGSAMKITDFDGWMLRYMWSKIKDEDGRFTF